MCKRHVPLDEFVEFVRRLIGESEETVELVLEMEVESAVADTGRPRNILRSRLVIATLDEKLARSLHQLAPALEFALGTTAQWRRSGPACLQGRLLLAALVQNGRFCGFSSSGARFLHSHEQKPRP